MLMKLFGNIHIHKGNMTRGSANIIYERDGELWIGFHDEFNGDMYPGGHYEDMILALSKIKTYEDFGLVMHRFNKEHHAYDDFSIYHKPLNEYLELVVKDNTIDLGREYYTYWFSDYVFFLNLTGRDFNFKTKRVKIGPEYIRICKDTIVAFNYGVPVGVYDRDNINAVLQYKAG